MPCASPTGVCWRIYVFTRFPTFQLSWTGRCVFKIYVLTSFCPGCGPIEQVWFVRFICLRNSRHSTALGVPVDSCLIYILTSIYLGTDPPDRCFWHVYMLWLSWFGMGFCSRVYLWLTGVNCDLRSLRTFLSIGLFKYWLCLASIVATE